MKGPKFEFYLLNYDHNNKKPYMYNIFNNVKVYEWTLAAVKKHLRSKKKYPYEKLKEDIKGFITNQQWSRVQYEISVGDPFPKTMKDFKKIDVYYQAEPNIDNITRLVIIQYKEWIKKNE